MAGYGRPGPADGLALWTDATAPKDAAQLAVHKKKVDEVKAWLVQFACPDGAAQQAGAPPGPLAPASTAASLDSRSRR